LNPPPPDAYGRPMRNARPRVLSGMLLFATLALARPGAAAGKPGYPDRITWGGRTWQVKSSQSRVGPGPNYFSASPANVSVDAQDRLHLRITYASGRWSCAEIIATTSFGYGSYVFTLASPVDALDPNVVLGLFTWSDKAAYHHREIDVEFSRWGNAADPTNAQYVVQPYDLAGHLHRFTQPTGAAPTAHGFAWRPGQVDFASSGPNAWTHTWSYTGSDVPRSGGENVRLNLWLSSGTPPTDNQEAEVILQTFSFTP
jgi:hypothetical protein